MESIDRSLERLAADRGITICFADLDGAEGLWLPEERTIMLGRGLSNRRAAEVLEHELSHVDIEDGHAALDAATGRRRVTQARWAVAGTAVACLALLLGISQLPDRPQRNESVPPGPQVAVVGPQSTSAGRSGSTTPSASADGAGGGGFEVRTRTVTVTAPAPATASAPTKTPSATIPRVAPGTTAPRVVESVEPSGSTSVQPSTPPTSSPPPDPTGSESPSPSLSAAETGAAGPW